MLHNQVNPGNSSSQFAGALSAVLSVEFAQLSDCGRVRDHNEDYVGTLAPENEAQARSRGWLFALADGVGGRERGEVASRMAVERITAGFQRLPPAESHLASLARLMQAANSAVYEAGEGSMATTVVACALRFDRAAIAHVGDSRCYLIRRGVARALTRDHTVANEPLPLGSWSAPGVGKPFMKHVLSRAVGTDLFVAAEVNEYQLAAGDLLLLCSDGLHGALSAADIGRMVTQTRDLEAAVEQLVETANERDGSDNVSVQLIRVRSVERVGMYRGRPYRLR
jgi:protein phosphatase